MQIVNSTTDIDCFKALISFYLFLMTAQPTKFQVKDSEPALALSPSPKEEDAPPEGAEDLQDPVRFVCQDLY